MKPDEQRVWAETLLKDKYIELGRIPRKSDFDDANCSRIKAFLGTWPQALKAAGLKNTKKQKDDFYD